MRDQEDLSEAEFCGLCGSPKEGEDEYGSFCEPCLRGDTDVPEIIDPYSEEALRGAEAVRAHKAKPSRRL